MLCNCCSRSAISRKKSREYCMDHGVVDMLTLELFAIEPFHSRRCCKGIIISNCAVPFQGPS